MSNYNWYKNKTIQEGKIYDIYSLRNYGTSDPKHRVNLYDINNEILFVDHPGDDLPWASNRAYRLVVQFESKGPNKWIIKFAPVKDQSKWQYLTYYTPPAPQGIFGFEFYLTDNPNLAKTIFISSGPKGFVFSGTEGGADDLAQSNISRKYENPKGNEMVEKYDGGKFLGGGRMFFTSAPNNYFNPTFVIEPYQSLDFECCTGNTDLDFKKCYGDSKTCKDKCERGSHCHDVLSKFCTKDSIKDEKIRAKCKQYFDAEMYDEIWTEYLNNFCNGENLDKQICHKYCNEGGGLCDKRLKDFCKYKLPTEDNSFPKFWETCGCYYPEKVYTKFKEKITSKYPLPIPLDTPHHCYFSLCTNSKIPSPTNRSNCPPNQITQCITKLDFDGKVKVGGDVNLSQDCKNIFNKDTPAPSEDTPAPSEDTPAPSEDTSTPSDDTSTPSDDTPSPTPDDKSKKNLYIGLGIGGGVLILILILALIFM